MRETLKTELTEFLYNRWIDQYSLIDSFLDFLEEQELTRDQSLKDEEDLIMVLDKIQENIFAQGFQASSEEEPQAELCIPAELRQEFFRIIRLEEDSEQAELVRAQAKQYMKNVFLAGQTIRRELAASL